MTSPSPARSVTDAYWPRALAAADAARARAQSGFTIASAIATGLIAAGLFTDVGDRAHKARYVGGAALGLWLAAMLLFLFAVAAPTGEPAEPQHSVEAFATRLVASVEGERRGIEWRLRLAVAVTSAAVLATAATVITGAMSWGIDRDRGQLVVAAGGLRALECAKNPVVFRGKLDVPTLQSSFVIFTLDHSSCALPAGATIRIPHDAVLAFAEKAGQ